MSTEAQAERLLRLLDRDDLDAAIDAGLAEFDPEECPSLPAAARQRLQSARERLLLAWAARDRHRARAARLGRRAEQLHTRRSPAAPAAAGQPGAGLPPAAVAALQRARERARGGPH